MLLSRFRKQPAEKLKFVIDYSERLGTNQLLTTVQAVIVTPVTDTLLIASPTLDPSGKYVYLYVSGGEAGKEYKIQVQVVTDDNGVTWEDEIICSSEEI